MDSYSILLAIIKLIVLIWDFITYPIYQAVQRPWEKRKAMRRTHAKPVRSSSEEVVYESPEMDCATDRDLTRAKVDTMQKAWNWAVRRYGPRPLLGTRDILGEEDEVQSNGKIFKKLELGDYRWLSYEEADSAADFFGKGMRTLGLNHGDKLCIFADTRCEWFLAAQGAFKQGFPLVTLYTNLGEEAVVHGVNQTGATHVITSHELLPKFRNILPHTDTVKHIIFIEDQIRSTDTTGFRDGVTITPFWEVVSMGKKSDDAQTAQPPSADDVAILMYTSGSTGVPKGVVITHRNLLFTMRSVMNSIQLDARPDDRYVAFLPLAHILELATECFMAMLGVRVGYSTPNTLIDRSSMVKRGCKGDCSLLKPTVMANVPLMLDRVYKTITEALRKKGPGFQKLFNWCYQYRKDAVCKGESTPIMDLLLFNNLRALFGGRIRMMFCGGAPLSRETQEFTCIVMGCPVLQGYGLTETSACATLCRFDMVLHTEVVGPPNVGMQIALVNWEEGNYRVTDRPRPRGEVIIGGPSISTGYYGMPEKTDEDFFDAHGRRWLRSGDIGQFEADGVLKIIDRKKDLVKLQFGEYVSLGKVEACLKTCPIVENVCIYGDSKKMFPVALVTPDRATLGELANKFGKQGMDFDLMCNDKDLTGAVLRELVNHGKKHKLEKFELPGAVKLCKELWTPDSGLVTAAFKLKRKPIQEFYQEDIDRMYGISRGV